MTEAQRTLSLLDARGIHVCPLIRTVVDMDALGETVGDAIALLRLRARSDSRPIRLVTAPHRSPSGYCARA